MIRTIREAQAVTAKLKSKALGLSSVQKSLLREVADGECEMKTFRLREALGADIFDAITLSASHNALIAGYGDVPAHWAEVAQVVPTSDFKNMNASALAGLPNLPIVPAGATYSELKQLDETVSYAVQKRGGILSVSMEAKANDALGAFNADARRMGAAAMTTLNEFVLGTLFDDNPACDYDTFVLWGGTGHANTVATDGVNLTNIQAGIAKIMAQTGRNGEQIYLMPSTLIVQPSMMLEALSLVNSTELMATVTGATTAGGLQGGRSNPLPKFINNVIVSPHINADSTMYYVTCGRANPIVQIAFVGGRQEPEIMFAPENTGSAWRNDTMEAKVRHSYGGDVVDHRPGCRIGA